MGFSLLIVLALNPGASAQPYYKHVDKDGVAHFTDTPTDPKFMSKEESVSVRRAPPLLSLDCKNLDIRTVLPAISDAWGVKILVAGDVQGSVTIRRMNTPADKLLDEILSMNNLVRLEEENSIIVARAENARQLQAEIDIQKQLLQTEGERNRLVSKIKNLSDQNLKDKKYPIWRKKAIIEAMQIMNSVSLSGDSSDVEFINAMKEFVDAIENENRPHMLELLADKARASNGQPGAVRAKPIHVWPSPPPPPPIVNVFK